MLILHEQRLGSFDDKRRGRQHSSQKTRASPKGTGGGSDSLRTSFVDFYIFFSRHFGGLARHRIFTVTSLQSEWRIVFQLKTRDNLAINAGGKVKERLENVKCIS